MLATVFVGVYPGVVLKGKMRSVTGAGNGNWAVSWSCSDAAQPGQRMALSCKMGHSGSGA